MMRSLKGLLGYEIQAKDGEIGEVDDFYFDSFNWILRYVVVDIGPWLFGRKVLVSTDQLGDPDWEAERFSVDLTKQQVKESPEIDVHKPVSRQHEIALHEYYGWRPYWFGPTGGQRMGYMTPIPPVETQDQEEEPETERKDAQESHSSEDEPHLRSAAEVTGYNVQARDGGAGSVHDFIVEDTTWDIQYLVVDTGEWLQERKVLFAPTWVKAIDYQNSTVVIDLSRETIESSPSYNPNAPVSRQYEESLFDHYERPYYWNK